MSDERPPVSPTLQWVAAQHAEAIAECFPFPHAAFLGLTAQRKHLCMAILSRGRLATREERAPFAESAQFDKLEHFLAYFAPDSPKGFAGVCGRLGEPAWPSSDYLRLMRLMAEDDNANEVLRHTRHVTTKALSVLEALPAPLRRAGVVRWVADARDAELITTVLALSAAIHGKPADLSRVARSLGQVRDRKRFFDVLLEILWA